MAGITIYCEGKSGSHDYDILSQVIDGLNVTIQPIGGKRGANAIIEFVEKGTSQSDFYLLFRDRDFDCPVPETEKLSFDEKKTYCSYRTTIENYLFDMKIFHDFLQEETLQKKHHLHSEADVKNIFIEVAKEIKDYQAVRYTLGELRTGVSFNTTCTKGSGELPENLDLNNCKSEAWKMIESAKTNANWTQEIFQTTLQKYLDKFDDKFFNNLQFLIFYQGKDFAKALTNKLQNFPLKNYYKYAKNNFDYTKFKDLVELRKIICTNYYLNKLQC